MKKIISRWWWLFILTLVLVAGGFVWFCRSDVIKSKLSPASTPSNEINATSSAQAQPTPPPPHDPLRQVNVLLLGYGGAGHDGGTLTDSMILAQIMPHDEKVFLINIPRDLWVEVPHKGVKSKINYAYAAGNDKGAREGGEYAKAAVEKIIGEAVDYYAAVDFAGFKKAINILTDNKGLEVDVPYSFADEFYPLQGEEKNPCDYTEEEIASFSAELKGYELEKMFPCRYETISYKKGPMTLSADDLLKFSRSRHSGVGGGDFGRSQRQQAVIAAAKKKIFTLGFATKLPALYEQYKKMVDTDLDLDIMTRALTNWGDVQNYALENIVLSNKNVLKDGRSADGQYVLLPKVGADDYSQLQEFISVSKTGQNWDDYVALQATAGAELATPAASRQ